METIKKDSNEFNKDKCSNKSPDKCPAKGTDKDKEQGTTPDYSRPSAKLGMQQNAKHYTTLPKEDGKDGIQNNRVDTVKEGEQNENDPKRNRRR